MKTNNHKLLKTNRNKLMKTNKPNTVLEITRESTEPLATKYGSEVTQSTRTRS